MSGGRIAGIPRPVALVSLLLGSSAPRAVLAQAPNGTGEAPSAAVALPTTSEPRPLAESLEGEAKRDYELGRLLYANGDYGGALARFENARKLSDDARLSWNAAVCHKGLHHYAKAIAAMRDYLASNSRVISAAERLSARNFLAAAELLTARLEASSNVSGARVYADGDDLGNAPLGSSARLDWGDHQIVFKKEGYLDYQQTVSVKSSADIRVVAVLRPLVHEGRIVVRAGSGDLIVIDGQPRAWGTWEGVLPSGSHALQVTASGFRAQRRWIVVADAQMRGFDITLERMPSAAVPAWLWLTGSAIVTAGVATVGYLVFRPDAPDRSISGSIATTQLRHR